MRVGLVITFFIYCTFLLIYSPVARWLSLLLWIMVYLNPSGSEVGRVCGLTDTGHVMLFARVVSIFPVWNLLFAIAPRSPKNIDIDP